MSGGSQGGKTGLGIYGLGSCRMGKKMVKAKRGAVDWGNSTNKVRKRGERKGKRIAI